VVIALILARDRLAYFISPRQHQKLRRNANKINEARHLPNISGASSVTDLTSFTRHPRHTARLHEHRPRIHKAKRYTRKRPCRSTMKYTKMSCGKLDEAMKIER
jgi:hypothetical protein